MRVFRNLIGALALGAATILNVAPARAAGEAIALPDVIGSTIGNAIGQRLATEPLTPTELKYGRGAFQLADSGQIANDASGALCASASRSRLARSSSIDMPTSTIRNGP